MLKLTRATTNGEILLTLRLNPHKINSRIFHNMAPPLANIFNCSDCEIPKCTSMLSFTILGLLEVGTYFYQSVTQVENLIQHDL